MSLASGSVIPRMSNLERRDSGGRVCCGMASRMICVAGERGEMMRLMPQRRRAMEMAKVQVLGEVDVDNARAVSAGSWYRWKLSGKPIALANARMGIQKGCCS